MTPNVNAFLHEINFSPVTSLEKNTTTLHKCICVTASITSFHLQFASPCVGGLLKTVNIYSSLFQLFVVAVLTSDGTAAVVCHS